MVYIDLTHFGKRPYKGIIENQKIVKVCLSETHAGKSRSLN